MAKVVTAIITSVVLSFIGCDSAVVINVCVQYVLRDKLHVQIK